MKKEILKSLAVCIVMGGMPGIAHAGFDFIPAPQQSPMPTKAKEEVEKSLPSLQKEQEPNIISVPVGAPTMTPVVGLDPKGAPVSEAQKKQVKSPESQPATAAYPPPYQTVPVAMPSVSVPIGPAPAVVAVPMEATPLAVISGFGDQIPFSFAMQQIVPTDFSVEYKDQPDPDIIVSWAGGRAWDKVLEDMLYAHGYRVRVTGKTVSIFKVQ